MCVRRCPTLPHPPGCSTIGAVSLSFRVRNGTGRFPHAITTVTLTPTPHTPKTRTVVGKPTGSRPKPPTPQRGTRRSGLTLYAFINTPATTQHEVRGGGVAVTV